MARQRLLEAQKLISMAMEELGDSPTSNNIKIELWLSELCESNGITPDRLKSSSRKNNLVDLRMIFCANARKHGATLKDIGYMLGGRDHSTVIHAIRQYYNILETDPKFNGLAKRMEALAREIYMSE